MVSVLWGRAGVSVGTGFLSCDARAVPKGVAGAVIRLARILGVGWRYRPEGIPRSGLGHRVDRDRILELQELR